MLVRRLGAQSAQGEVWIADDLNEGDQVAIKVMNPSPEPWREAQILRQLTDPHILPIRNADQDSGLVFLVTEIARHGSLETEIRPNGLGVEVNRTVRLIRQACMGLARAHSSNIVHNDVKPANLFLDANDGCLVGDFGMAALVDRATQVGQPPGFTLLTASPEALAGWVSFPSDVYSIAATAYWLLSGIPPIAVTAATPAQAHQEVMTTTVKRLWDIAPHVSRCVNQAVMKGLSKSPADRQQSPTEFAEDLRACPAEPTTWQRTDHHGGHAGCWTGSRSQRGYNICLKPIPESARMEVLATHALSGRRVVDACGETARASWPSSVRSAIRTIG